MNKNIYNGFYLHRSSDAENLKNEVLETIRVFGKITIGDYYELAVKYPTNWEHIYISDDNDPEKMFHILTNYGWKNLLSIDILELLGGEWKLAMPKPTNLFEHEEEPEMPNDISNPDYYKSEGIEVIDVIRAFTDGLTGGEAFAAGNIIKYACRWKKKNGVSDLKKILWYTQYLINLLSERTDDNLEEEFIVNETLIPSLAIRGLTFENGNIVNEVIRLAKAHIQTFGFLTLRDFITTIVRGRTKEKVTIELRPDIDPNRYGWKYDTFSHVKGMQLGTTDCFMLQLPALEEKPDEND